MPTAAIYFKLPGNDGSGGGDIWYKLDKAAVNECGLEFDIDGITTINWSGMASTLAECTAPTVSTLEIPAAKLALTTNFIRNRLTQLTLSSADGAPLLAAGAGGYSLVLTGGNITIENNLSYLTPETLGVVNQPLGHVMGTRSVSGNFTCYLNTIADGSAELFENIIEGTGQITNSFDLDFAIGGAGQTPRIDVSVPRAHFELPSHSVEDVISLDVAFHGLPGDISDNQIAAGESEITVTYTA